MFFNQLQNCSGHDPYIATHMMLSHANKDIGISSNLQPNLTLGSNIYNGHGQCLFWFAET